MGTYFWAHWLADALRKDPFVAARLIEVPGWRERGRPPSQYNFLPSGILDHHTACMIRLGHDPQNDLNVIANGRDGVPGPISQLLGTWTPPGTKWNGSNVSPRILVVAAGRANHAGVGTYPWGAPEGNGSSIGIEWCGPPEVGSWPDEVIELRERVDVAILRHNGWGIHQVTTHWEYGTPRGRKIDPSGPHASEPNLKPTQPWDPNKWRADIMRRFASTDPQQPTEPEVPSRPVLSLEDNMKIYTAPPRIMDTRSGLGGPIIEANSTRVVQLPPDLATAKAVTVNVTAVQPASDGFLVVGVSHLAGVSHLNYTSGETVCNAVPIPVTNGAFPVWVSTRAHVIIDVLSAWD